MRIGPKTILPATREAITLRTADGLDLVGELAVPSDRETTATAILLHPLPTGGGSMDSHLLRKAAQRLPAQAGIAVLRFNTRGTLSAAGRSQGAYDDGVGEGHDVAAAIALAAARGLPDIWLVGWSFGTDLALVHGCDPRVRGAVLLAPPVHKAHDGHLAAWAASGKPVVCLVPEHDDYLRPDGARQRFAPVPNARVVGLDGAGHLFVGHTDEVLATIVATLAPHVPLPLPDRWDGDAPDDHAR